MCDGEEFEYLRSGPFILYDDLRQDTPCYLLTLPPLLYNPLSYVLCPTDSTHSSSTPSLVVEPSGPLLHLDTCFLGLWTSGEGKSGPQTRCEFGGCGDTRTKETH